ncbi:MAG TPA: hypothetical protein VF504_02685, partial [Solirubrobacterales bacterium]
MRRTARLSICLVALASVLLPATASAEPGRTPALAADGPMGAVGQTVVAVIGASGADRAVDAIGDSLALLNARRQIETTPSAEPEPAAAPAVPTAAEIAADPSKLPPASAGSNGTTVPHRSRLSREEIFAHS